MGALLDIEAAVAELKNGSESASAVPSFGPIGHGFRPGWGLASSIILHEIAFLFLVFLCYSSIGIRLAASTKLNQTIDLSRANDIVYLPSLGGGSEGSGSTGTGKGDSPHLPARSSKGFSHPGPQPIISDPPRALNPNQTVLHPTVKNPPLLKEFVPLPNLVQMANAGPPQPPQPVQPLRVKQEAPVVSAPAVATLEPPKLVVPAGAAHKIPDLSALQPAPATAQLKLPDPPPVEVSDLRMRGPDQRNILALSPIPPPPQIPVKIPAGEARGSFAISPEAVAEFGPGPGSRTGGPATASVGIGDRQEAMASNAVGSSGDASGGGASAGSGAGVAGHGIGRGESRGGGVGSGAGAGVGVGSGAGPGSGSGVGSGPGHGGFPGITIQGGRLGTGAAGIRAAIPSGPASYTMTVVSTAASGGGLPDFGVFLNEKVYTVFLKLNLADQRPAPSWTLQYAPLKPVAKSVSVDGLIVTQATLDPPYAVTKEMPEWPADARSKYARKLVVVSAIMDTDGNLGSIVVRQTPDAELVPIVTEALKKWVFLPAEHIGQPIALKVLFGIPVPAAQ